MALYDSVPENDDEVGLKAQFNEKDSPIPEKEGKATNTNKMTSGQSFLDVPNSRASIDTLSGLSIYSLEDLSTTRSRSKVRSPSRERDASLPATSPAAAELGGGKWQQTWERQKGVVLMILAQFFGASMATTARFMEITTENGEPMSTFQILFVRMSITMVTSMIYMYYAKVPHAPFGAKEVRPLLLARGFGGFFGVFGLYYSLVYLPLAEATVITFLAPMVAAWVCSIIIKSSFTRTQQICGLVSIFGVVLIAQPFSFTSPTPAPPSSTTPTASNGTFPSAVANITSPSTDPPSQHVVTPAEHAFAVCIALVGVCGAASAYTTISWIGKRAHPIISVNYFAMWCTIVSSLVLLFVPSVSFRLPSGIREWSLMAFLGFSGFVMQFLLTTALAHSAKTGKGLNMVYTQMLFALALDKAVWGTSPGGVSIVGSGLILGSALWVAVKREEGKREGPEAEGGELVDEEAGLVEGMEGAADERRESVARGAEEVELRPMRT